MMSGIPLLSNRRPIRKNLYFICLVLTFISAILTADRLVVFNTGIGVRVDIVYGQITLRIHSDFIGTPHLWIPDAYIDMSDWNYSHYLLPRAEIWRDLYGMGFYLSLPCWILAGIFALFYLRARRKFTEASRDISWCRKCGYDISMIESEKCPECGHPRDARNRVSLLQWIASNMFKTKLFRVQSRIETTFRLMVGVILFCAFFLIGLRYSEIILSPYEAYAWDWFVTAVFIQTLRCCLVGYLAWIATRIVLIPVFLERPFVLGRPGP